MAALGAFAPALPAAPWAPADKKKTGMIVRSARQENLEMEVDGFTLDITPIERFFTRSHHYVPKVDLSTWKLQVTGEVPQGTSFTFEQIQRMPKTEVAAVLECAGNGRSFYEPSMPGLQWEWGAVGNGRWAGVRLADLLKEAGVKPGTPGEVVFDGADVPVGTMPDFQRSIPLNKAMQQDAILAYEMNGEPLPTLHGFPLRLVVPGWAGDCWVKWVTRITVMSKEFDGFFMKTAYRHPGQAVKPGSSVDPAKMHPVTELQMKSVIGYPVEGAQLEVGKPVTVKGTAWSNTRVNALQVSLNAGVLWHDVKAGDYNGPFSWRTWTYQFTPEKEGFLQIIVRGGDDTGARQPFIGSWNPSGYMWNVPHSIGVEVVSKLSPEGSPTAPPLADAAAKNPAAYQQSCLACHEEDVIRQQRLTRAQWEREMDKMIRWGAKVKPTDREAILNHLSTRFPYRPRK